jgi:iron complex outermembrane receptor protein
MNTKHSPGLARRISLPLCLGLTVSTGALAQTAQEGHVEDVVVSAPAEPAPAEPAPNPATTAADAVAANPLPQNVRAFSQKQAVQFQNTPQAVTVITEQQLQNLGITNIQTAQKLVPTLNYKFSNVRNLTINIRGFGAASSSATDGILGGVPIYIDGVYQPRPGAAIFDVPDLVGIEVLKGPQGTSGGQDSTGGVVKLNTALPSFVASQFAEATYGSYNQVQFKGSSTGPIAESDQFAYRLAVFTNDYQGQINNILGGQDFNDWHSKGARAQLLYAPSKDFSARFIVDYGHINQACCVNLFEGVATQYANGAPVANNYLQRMARLGFFPPTSGAPNNYTTAQVGYQQTAQESFGAAAIVDYTFNGFDLNSVASYRGWDFHPNNRSNYGWPELNTNSNGHVNEKSVTEDLKISSPKGQKVEASVGVWFLWEQLYDWGLTTYGQNAGAFYGSPTLIAGNAALSRTLNNEFYNYLGRQSYDNPETKNVAPYAQAVLHATTELDITGGLRYSLYDKASIFRQYQFSTQQFPAAYQALFTKTILGAVNPATGQFVNGFIGPNTQYTANTNNGFLSALASASYKFAPDVMGYVTFSRGGRDGGPNPSANLPAGVPTTVNPETLDNYEVGLKSEWLDNRLLANVALFAMVDHNYITQLSVLQSGGNTVSYLANADSAISRGVEADIRYKPIDDLTTYLSAAYDDAFYGSFNNSPCPFEITSQPNCNFTGQRLSLVPRWAAAGGFEYSYHLGQPLDFVPKPLVAYVGADFTFQTSTFSNTDNSIYSVIPAYALINAHAGVKFEDASWDLSTFVNNAANFHYFINSSAANLPGGIISGNVGAPLVAGVTLRARL